MENSQKSKDEQLGPVADFLASVAALWTVCFIVSFVITMTATIMRREIVCDDTPLRRLEYAMPVRPLACWLWNDSK